MQFKKGQVTIQNLGAIILLLVVAGLVATFASDIVSDINDDQTADSAAANASRNTLTGILNLTGQFGNVGTVVGAGLIIGILLTAFAVRRLGQ